MKKSWRYKGVNYTMEEGPGCYGDFILNGYHCTESYIWDYVDDDNYPKQQRQAKREAESFLRTKSY